MWLLLFGIYAQYPRVANPEDYKLPSPQSKTTWLVRSCEVFSFLRSVGSGRHPFPRRCEPPAICFGRNAWGRPHPKTTLGIHVAPQGLACVLVKELSLSCHNQEPELLATIDPYLVNYAKLRCKSSGWKVILCRFLEEPYLLYTRN